MIHWWYSICLHAGDGLLGWTLSYPRDSVVCTLGLVVGALLYVLRRWTTDGQLLQQMTADQRRLRELIAEAKSQPDPDRLQRLQHIQALLLYRRSREEFLSICLSLVLLAALSMWCQQRLGMIPWQHGDVLQVSAVTPPAAIGEIIHIVPSADLQAADGWLREITSNRNPAAPAGTAAWSLRLTATSAPREITLRWGTKLIVHHLMLDDTRLADLVQHHDGLIQTSVPGKPYRPLNLLPAHLIPGLPGWALLMTIAGCAMFLQLKRVEKNNAGRRSA